MAEDFIADVEAVLLEQEPPCTAKLFDFRKNQVRMVKVVPKRMWLDFNLKTLGVEVPLPEGDVPYVEAETKIRKDGEKMKYPITMDSIEARRAISVDRHSLNILAGDFAKAILKENPTLDEAQAVLVKTWDAVLLNARLTIPQKKQENGCTER
nr:MAG TPA: hypothetical protein [Caudoviricetes sp.]